MLSAPTNGQPNHDLLVHRKPNRKRNGTMNELDYFRDEVQTFLAEHLTAELQRAGRLEAGIYAERPVAEAWLKILDQKGWAVPSWPTEWGGTDWSAEQHAIWQQELTLASAPSIPLTNQNGGPGNHALRHRCPKSHYLPRIRQGIDWWAQGYSEPGAGSDLASLKCAPCATATTTS